MAEALSIDLRKRVVDAVTGGMSRRQAAAHFKVGVSSAIRWVAQGLATGDLAPKRRAEIGGRRRSRPKPTSSFPCLAPTATPLWPRCAPLWRTRAIPSAFRRSRVSSPEEESRSKKKPAHAAEQDRLDILKRRRAWFEAQLDLDPAKLVFVDETWASTNMARRYGRAPRGEQLRAAIPRGHWKTTTFVAGLRREGIVAPLVFGGPINAQVFEAYVEQFLAPALRPDDIVVIDNLSSHKAPRIRELIEAADATLLFLPPYSPDFNPIEKMFSKLKALLPQGRRENRRRPLARHRRLHRPRHAARMRQLLRGRRV